MSAEVITEKVCGENKENCRTRDFALGMRATLLASGYEPDESLPENPDICVGMCEFEATQVVLERTGRLFDRKARLGLSGQDPDSLSGDTDGVNPAN